MADHSEVLSGIHEYENVSYPVLVPNLKGLNAAVSILMIDKIILIGLLRLVFTI